MAHYHLNQDQAVKTLGYQPETLAENVALHKGNIELFAEQLTEGAFPGFSVVQQRDDLVTIEDWATEVRRKFKHVVVIGMGGSTMGGMVLAGFIRPARGSKPTLHFMNNPDPVVIQTLCQDLPLKQTAVLAISKSGATIETLLTTGLVLDAMKEKNINARGRVWALTVSGATPLARMVQGQGGGLIRHDPKMGGRYSVFSNVGLLVGTLAGLDGQALRKGAQSVLQAFCKNPTGHGATAYGLLSVLGLKAGYRAEVLMPYGQQLALVADWWAQLWAESLGKEGWGTTPIRAVGSADQHSQLQLYADGANDKLYTFIAVAENKKGVKLSGAMASLAGLRQLNGLSAGALLHAQSMATAESLGALKRPVRMLTLADQNEESLGALLMHLMLATVVAGIAWRVNPFNQPAVEDSKKRAMAHLNKKGF